MSLWKRITSRKLAKKAEPQFKAHGKSRIREGDQFVNHKQEERFQGSVAKSIQARWLYWSKLGKLAPDLITPQVNPIYKNIPAWPANRLAFLTVEREEATILVTDGLSDPFAKVNGDSQGYGIEFFIEVAERPLSDLSRNIAVETLMSLAYNAVARGGVDDLLEEYGVFSMEIPESDLPNTHLTQDGSACVLLGGPKADFEPLIVPGPLEDIELISVTVLTGKEAEIVREFGASARADIAQNLIEAGIGHRVVLGRPSVL